MALTLAARSAAAQDATPPSAPADTDDDDDDDVVEPAARHHKKPKHAHDAEANADQRQHDSKTDADKQHPHDVKLKARLFTLAELSHRRETVVNSDLQLVKRNRDALDLSLESARVSVAYRSPLRWLSAELELELAGKPRTKDAFVEAGKHVFVKAGQFKLPSARLELASPWTLPLARRGLVHALMVHWLDVAGRRPGLAVGFRSQHGLKPRLTLGAFQGTTLKQVVPGDRDVQLIDHASLEAQTFAARGELSLYGVTLGAWGEERVGSTVPGTFRHFATFGLDATLSERLGRGALRVWLDASGGKSLYVNADKPGSRAYPWFAAGRALVGYRLGGLAGGEVYVEPYGFVAVMDPDTEVVADFVSEAALGLSAGFWDHARLSLQGEVTHAQRNFPNGFLDSAEPAHKSLLLQAGARF